MASVNPILDPWIYILLRRTVFLKVVEKIKCLFCRMGGRRRGHRGQRGSRGQFCTDDGRSTSFVSHDSPSLVSRCGPRDTVTTSHTFLYPPEGNERTLSSGEQQGGGRSPPAVETVLVRDHRQSPGGHRKENKLSVLEPSAPGGRLCGSVSSQREVPLVDQTLYVTFTDETSNLQEKCI